MQPDQLVAELLARGDMNDDTTLELNRILNEWRASALHPEDEAYLVALHAKLMNLTPEPDAPTPIVAAARLEGLSIEEWRERALKAEAELAQVAESARNG